MKQTPAVKDLLFDVDQVAIEAVVGSNGSTRRISIPGKKALLNQRTGLVLGVVSRDYRVVTNQEAVNLARDVCEKAFPGLSTVEWEAKRAAAPRTLSYAFIDLMHKTHVLNYWDSEIKKDDPFTPFLRVTNSFNGARALRFDIGFMRKHCSNGVIFEEEIATIKASHSKEALAQLKIEITSRSLPQMWDEFSKFLTSVRSICNAVFNTLTDIAARPPDSVYFQKDRDTIEKRSGRWLKELALHNQTTGFDLNAWIPAWEAGGSGRQIPGRN